ncbi:MAG: DUF4422 domain-containing protein [Saccharofermentans sp.]|nr:DUF4422 domain-containing protein [Saccharofermentans sp.]
MINSASQVTVIVCAHKPYAMPEDKMYLPCQVGAEGKAQIDGFTPDNTGDNISSLNYMYCELTGLYWAWKNLDSDYIGLVHYRRLFKGKNGTLTYDEAMDKLSKYKLIVPAKRRYYIETLYSHYVHTHQAKELDLTRQILEKMHPEDIPFFDKAMKQTWGYMFNMMIMPKDLMDSYCSWLFPIIDELVEQMGESDMSGFDLRYPGRISELLFNCRIAAMLGRGELKADDICEVPFVYTEKINKFEKGMAFLKAKFFGKRQEKSF